MGCNCSSASDIKTREAIAPDSEIEGVWKPAQKPAWQHRSRCCMILDWMVELKLTDCAPDVSSDDFFSKLGNVVSVLRMSEAFSTWLINGV